MVAQLEVSCWACHAMHKVVALASSSRPACSRHWPVGGFQQCGVCVLTSCCSLSVVRLCFVLRAGLLVSFPERMVSRNLGSALVLHPSDFCEVKYFLQCLLLQYFANVRLFLLVCSGVWSITCLACSCPAPKGRSRAGVSMCWVLGLALILGFIGCRVYWANAPWGVDSPSCRLLLPACSLPSSGGWGRAGWVLRSCCARLVVVGAVRYSVGSVG